LLGLREESDHIESPCLRSVRMRNEALQRYTVADLPMKTLLEYRADEHPGSGLLERLELSQWSFVFAVNGKIARWIDAQAIDEVLRVPIRTGQLRLEGDLCNARKLFEASGERNGKRANPATDEQAVGMRVVHRKLHARIQSLQHAEEHEYEDHLQ
jgi:hypothetical protein